MNAQLQPLDDEDEENWPKCKRPGCAERVNPRRVALGYRNCLKHGEPKKTPEVEPLYDEEPEIDPE